MTLGLVVAIPAGEAVAPLVPLAPVARWEGREHPERAGRPERLEPPKGAERAEREQPERLEQEARPGRAEATVKRSPATSRNMERRVTKQTSGLSCDVAIWREQ
jgi:hypothetical protein